MVMLLAFEITACNGEQNNLSVEMVFMFSGKRDGINSSFY